MKILYLIIPVLVALVLCLWLLFKPKVKIPATKVLAFYFFLFAVLLASMACVLLPESVSRFFMPVVNLMSLLFYVCLLAIPSTMYFYIFTLTHRYERFNKIELVLVHYYPAIALLIINLFAFGYLYTGNENSELFTGAKLVMEYANFIALMFLFPLFNIFYIYKSFIIYKNHRVKVKDVFAYDTGVSLQWIRTFILGYFILMVGIILLEITMAEKLYLPLSLVLTLYFLFTGIMGYQQSYVKTEVPDEGLLLDDDAVDNVVDAVDGVLLNPAPTTHTEHAPTQPEVALHKKEELLESGLKDELREKLIALMENEEVFLEKKLSIHQVAQMLNSNSKYISHVLNSCFNQNFSSFINNYRIEKARELLSDESNDNYTIEAIGKMSGFNSKSAFNLAFKNICLLTPSAYRKNREEHNP